VTRTSDQHLEHRPSGLARRTLRIVLVVLAAILGACDGITAPPASPWSELPATTSSSLQLGRLLVAPPRPMTGYSRARFPHWTEQAGCTTRELVLERDGQNVTGGLGCTPASGRWHSAYDGAILTDPAVVDVDHLVPLANAWRSGADRWTDLEREAFANDMDHPELLAVSRASNRAKGDQAPDQWRPPNRGFWCAYARAWVEVKAAWELTITATERRTLEQMLGSCVDGGRR
jgi:Protein of unknown function (DUF1524)